MLEQAYVNAVLEERRRHVDGVTRRAWMFEDLRASAAHDGTGVVERIRDLFRTFGDRWQWPSLPPLAHAV